MSVEAEQVRILARIDARLEALQERLDDQRNLAERQHAENVGRLVSIEREVRVTNGRVNGHDTKLTLHESYISALRRASNAWLNEIVRYVAVAGGTYGVLKILGLIK